MNAHRLTSLSLPGSLLLLALTASAQTYVANLTGLEEVPANASPGMGMATAVLTGSTLVVDGSFSGLMANYSASHIHAAPMGVNGPVVFGLSNFGSGTSGGWVGGSNTFTLTPTQVATLEACGYYINVHSSVLPGGEIRGQLCRRPTADTQDRPMHFQLGEAYPNPFNPGTTLEFNLERTAPVRLAVYNIAGDEVAVLADGLLGAGEHSVEFNAGNRPSGVYFMRLDSEGASETRKLMLVK